MVSTTVVGNYPRIGDAFEEQRLRRAIAKFEEEKLTEAELREVERSVVREVIADQVDAGIELPTDGEVTWYDSQSHFSRHLDGVEVTGLVRYFDTNTYYRQPVRTGPSRWSRPVVLDDWKAAREAADGTTVKAVVTGPYTLASLAKLGTARTRDAALELADTLAQEVSALASAGAAIIQVDEPALTRNPKDVGIAAETTERLARAKGRAELHLFTYFGDVASIWKDLVAFPVDNLGLDLVQGAATLAAIRKHGSKVPLTLGLVDARNTKREDPRDLAKLVQDLANLIPLASSYLSPSNGLEFLPRASAREKLGIVAIAAKLAGAAS